MSARTADFNYLWAQVAIEELRRNGVELFVLSPGSRSTPLVAATARNPKISKRSKVIAYDERGAAYLAVGYARATGKAAVLISTSGTAVANYFPALVEASRDQLPIIVLTADRPPELIKTGANQTIQQRGIFGEYVKWEFELPAPAEEIPLKMLLTTIDQAYAKANHSPKGVVHLNCPFREPFLPPSRESFLNSPKLPKTWIRSNRPYTTYFAPHYPPAPELVKEVTDKIQRNHRVLLLAGRLHSPTDQNAIKELSLRFKLPLVSCITSGLRMEEFETNIHYFDQMLLSEKLKESLKVDVVLQFGNTPVSKRWLEFVSESKIETYIQVNDHPDREDPGHVVTHRGMCQIAAFCEALRAELDSSGKINSELLDPFIQANQIIKQILANHFEENFLTEPGLAWTVSRSIPEDSALFLASSMPVRDFDMYAFPSGITRVAANRGASGIDGTIASAVGYSRGLETPVIAVLGDLALLHDMNSLHLLRELSHPMKIVVINNQGGGIFSFLPIREQKDIFETYFSTPHNFSFSPIAEMFSLNYFQPENSAELKNILATTSSEHVLIEIFSDKEKNWQEHTQLQKTIRKKLDSMLRVNFAQLMVSEKGKQK